MTEEQIDKHFSEIVSYGEKLEAYGIIVTGILAHAHQSGTLHHTQILGFLTEVSLGSRLDAHRIVKEIEVVEIHAHNLFLGIETLQLDGYHPLDRLLQESFMHALRLLGIELLGQLLRNGTAASSALAAGYHA